MAAPILALRDASVRFGVEPLFEGVDFGLLPGDRACLVGRNGSGKSTLLKVLAGLVELDSGELFVQPGIKIAYLPQNPDVPVGILISDYVAGGLDQENSETGQFRVRGMLSALDLNGEAELANLSGGGQRRAALARAMVMDPDVLLMDEPTNHLDIPTVQWLERELGGKRAAILLISHDRAFLRTLSQRTFWLRRGRLRARDRGYAHFDEWSDEVANEEESARRKMDKKLGQEARWLQRGVTARRKRNQGRLERLYRLREERSKVVRPEKRPKAELGTGDVESRQIIRARNISKSFGEATIVDGFSTKIMRGDRIGIVGPNGAGKTTLIRLLTGELEPDVGTIKRADGIEPAYFDQNRAQLDPALSLWETLTDKKKGGGGDSIEVRGAMRHVVGYLKEFLFDPDQAKSPVGSLSGGERNRLMLAKLFAKPGNLLVLDEPTNDLDMDMLDLLEDMLASYEGTLLLVSHDRDFLDRLVGSVISFDPDGKLREYAGGYTDMLAQRGDMTVPDSTDPEDAPVEKARQERPKTRTKLSYKDQRQLDLLPGKIDQTERDIAALESLLGDPAAYDNGVDWLNDKAAELDAAKEQLEQMHDEWIELEMLRESIEEEAS